MSNEKEEVAAVNLDALIAKKIDTGDGKTDLEKSEEELAISLGDEITLPDNGKVKKPVDNGSQASEEEGEETEEEEEETPNPPTKKEISNYSKVLKGILGEEYENVLINVEGEDVPISELEMMDEETFQDIVDDHIRMIKENAEKDRISVKSVSEFTKALIEIEKNGGDISQLLEDKRDFGDPLSKIDLGTASGQKEAIKLRLSAAGQSPDQISRLIKSYEADGELEEYGKAAYEELKNYLDKQTELKVQKSRDDLEKREKALKEFKKDLKENLSEFEMKDSLKGKLIDVATKKNQSGDFIMDVAYEEQRADPKRAGRLALFLTDEEEYIRQVTNKSLIKAKLDQAQKRVVIRKNSTGLPGEQVRDDNKDKAVSLSEIEQRKINK